MDSLGWMDGWIVTGGMRSDFLRLLHSTVVLSREETPSVQLENGGPASFKRKHVSSYADFGTNFQST